MKNNKKHIYKRTLISLLLMMVMVFSMNNIKAVTDDEYFAGNQLKQLGILKGYPDGTLRLEQSISRSEVATMMVRVRGYANTNYEKAKEIGVILKDSEDSPTKIITRGEMALIVWDSLLVKVELGL